MVSILIVSSSVLMADMAIGSEVVFLNPTNSYSSPVAPEADRATPLWALDS